MIYVHVNVCMIILCFMQSRAQQVSIYCSTLASGEAYGPGVGQLVHSLGWLVDFQAQITWSEPPRMAVKMGGWVCKISNFQDIGIPTTVSRRCMHDFCARASAPWKIFCCLLKFLLKKCYKCRVGSKKSESGGLVGWLSPDRSSEVPSHLLMHKPPLVRRTRSTRSYR